MMLAGERAELRIETENPYVSGYVEPNSSSDQPEPKIEYIETGTTLEVLAKLTDDGANIMLDIDFEISRLSGFEEHVYKGRYTYQTPSMYVLSSSTTVLMPDGGTVLIGGRKITVENDDGHIEEKNLLVLIKAKKVEEDQTDAEALEAIEGRGY
jgi:type II secretory pathway component GspD/PulD (secretin)